MSILFVTVMAGIWFAAVYTSHHYILDVLAGIICAITGIILFQAVLMRSKAFSSLLNKIPATYFINICSLRVLYST